jgi:hypothetical protein
MSYQFQIKRFNWVSRPSAWQRMKTNNARIAAGNARFLSLNAAAGSTMFGALINQSSGRATITAQVALTRIQAAAKSALNSSTKQIDQAQSVLDQAKAVGAGSSTSTTATTGTFLDTVA